MLGFIIQFVVEYVIPTIALIALGGYLEHKFGAKVAARVTALEARVAAAEAAVNAAKK